MSDFATMVAGEELLDMHINQFAGWLNGDDSDWYGIAAPKANDASNYLLTLRNIGAGGKALNVLNSSGASVFSVSNTGFALAFPIVNSDEDGLTGEILQRIEINAQDWGVDATATDQTPAINALFEALRTLGDDILVPGEGMGVYFPSGKYSCASINVTRLKNIDIRCVPGGTFFFHDQQGDPQTGQVPARVGNAGPCWDFTGTSNIRVSGIGIAGAVYGSAAAPDVVPTCAILQCASENPGAPGFSYGDSNANYYEFIGGYGHFSLSFLYLYSTADTTFVWFHADITNSPTKPNIYISGSNGGTAQSLYVNVDPTHTDNCVNFTFINVGAQGIHIDNTSNVNFFGGSVDGTTTGYCCEFAGFTEKIAFYNTQFTAGVSVTYPDPLGTAGGAIKVGVGAHRGMTFVNPFLNNVLYSASIAFIRTEANAVFSGLNISGLSPYDVPSGRKIINANNASPVTTVTLDGGSIDAGGGDITTGGSIQGTTFKNVGTMVLPSGATWVDREPQFTAAKSIATGDFVATSGWATSPSISAVSGNVMAGSFTVTSGASGAGGTPPVVTFTYPVTGGIFTAAPVIMCQFVNSSDWTAAAAALTNIKCVTTTTTCVFTMEGMTPAATAKTYTFAFKTLTG